MVGESEAAEEKLRLKDMDLQSERLVTVTEAVQLITG
ncbi:hypothetical protein ACFTAO_13645 [Paenibacillus rhizoplanae]